MFWRAPVGGDWTIRFSSADFDVVARAALPVNPTICSGNELDCEDDGNGPNGARLSFTAFEGQDILISVDAFRNTGSGKFTMTFSRTGETPVSDGDCDNPSDLMAFGAGLDIFAAFACNSSTCRNASVQGACVTECVPTLISAPLSEDCSGCFVDYIDCVIGACGPDCLEGDSCDECDYDGRCGEPFQTCSGL